MCTFLYCTIPYIWLYVTNLSLNLKKAGDTVDIIVQKTVLLLHLFKETDRNSIQQLNII